MSRIALYGDSHDQQILVELACDSSRMRLISHATHLACDSSRMGRFWSNRIRVARSCRTTSNQMMCYSLVHCWSGSATGSLTARLPHHWLTSSLTGSFTGSLSHSLVHCLIHWLTVSVTGSLSHALAHCLLTSSIIASTLTFGCEAMPTICNNNTNHCTTHKSPSTCTEKSA